jgi:CDGSH-type Zn-finger protein/uncharacterized Fe-S cluster protein YjdI
MSASLTKEPEIITHNREQLAYLLTEAAEIEHGLMCCYLFAAHTLKRGTGEGLAEHEAAAVERWRGAIVQVAIDEMLHLALVNNLLSAIGSAPHFQRPNFPVSPGYHPAGVVVSLAPFDRATLDHFVFLERPEGVEAADGAGFEAPVSYERAIRPDHLVPSSQDYATVGHLYRGIRAGVVSLAGRMGEGKLFIGAPAAQIDASVVSLPGLTAVTDVASAVRAVDTIVEQGEGSPTNPERSHYRRFLAVRTEYEALLAQRPGFAPALPVARNPVMRKPPDPRGKIHVDHPKSAPVMDIGNALYAFALRSLGRAFGQPHDGPDARGTLIDASFEAMRLLSPVSQLLCRLPATESRPGVHAGLSFTMQRSTVGFSQPDVAWTILAERAREIAAACNKMGDEPTLRRTAEALSRLGDRLERVRSDAPHAAPAPTGAPAPTPGSEAVASQAEPTSEPSAVEEAHGRQLVLRFEAKRCIHARFCVLGAPEVFLANVKGSWLRPDAMPVESLVAIAHSCPSGAITYERLDGGSAEAAPPVNVLRIRENGPLAVHAQIDLDGRAMHRATLCRCGASRNKPFCDGSHATLPFVASGEPVTQPSEPLAMRNGPLSITPTRNGPLAARGSLEICSGTGRTVTRVESVRLCRCGGSSNKPFCDGTHARIGFQAE